MTNKMNTLKKISIIAIIITMFFAQNLISVLSVFNFDKKDSVYAESVKTEVTIANKDFTSHSSVTTPAAPDSFTTLGTQGSTIAGVIDTELEYFSENYEEKYKLSFNPSAPKISEDTKVLMINNQSLLSNFGYETAEISLDANSYYVISAYVYTQNTDGRTSTASLYLYNDKIDEMDESKIENISTRGAWREYRFYIQTALTSEKVKLQLYIGTKDNFKSDGAVFFDSLSAFSLSKDVYFNEISTLSVAHQVITLNAKDVSVTNGILNGDFETATNDFSRVATSNGNDTTGNVTGIVGIGESFNSTYCNLTTNPTSANRNDNAYALLINNNSADYVAYENKNIKIEQHKLYKLSFDLYTSSFNEGGVNVTLTQQNPFTSENYTVASDGFTNISTSEEENLIKNNWITYYFLIKGNVFKNSNATLTIALGAENSLVKGFAFFDNFKLEEITSDDYTNLGTSSYSKSIDFTTTTETASVANGAFNEVTINSTEDAYPFSASDWTINNSDEANNYNGIVNVNTTVFNSYGFAFNNPASVNNSNTDLTNNNVFVLANTVKSYQSAQSKEISLSAASYYKMSIYVQTQSLIFDTGAYVTVSNSTKTIATFNNIKTDGNWKEFAVYIKTFDSSESFYLNIGLGTSDSQEKGYAIFDNAKLETIEESDYLDAENTNYTYITDLSVVDLTMLSTSSNYYYTPLNLKGTNYGSGNCEAGVINSSTHPTLDIGQVDDEYVLAIHNITDSYYTMQTTDFNLTSSNYYKVSVAVKTLYTKQEASNVQKDDNDEIIPFGAKIELTNIGESFSGITNENEFEVYTFYIYATSDTTINFKLSLGSEDALTSGYAFFDDIKIEKIDEATFTTASSTLSDDEHTLVIGDTEKQDDDGEEETNSTSGINFDWLVVPTLILAIALLVAMIGLLIRRIDFKLPVKIKEQDYDRAKTIVREHERRERIKAREERLRALRQMLAEVQLEIDANKAEYRNARAMKEALQEEHEKIEAQIKETYKDTSLKEAKDEARKLKLEAKQRLKQLRKEKYLARRQELIAKLMEIEKEIDAILEEERLLIEEYKAYRAQVKLEKRQNRANKSNKKK